MVFERRTIVMLSIVDNDECWTTKHLAECALNAGEEGEVRLPKDAPSWEQATVRVSFAHGELKEIEL